MFEFSIFMMIALIIILLGLAYLILTTLKRYSRNNLIETKTEIILITIIIIAGIIIFPWFFTQSFFSVYNLSKTGQIGDTIGGITSPFINGVGAILIYIAFKEQVNSSKSAREEKRIDLITENLNRLQNDPYKIESLCKNCQTDLSNRIDDSDQIMKLTRVMREFQSLSKFINSLNENKDFAENKFYLTWKLHYEPSILLINKQIITISITTQDIRFIVGTAKSFNTIFSEITETVENYK